MFYISDIVVLSKSERVKATGVENRGQISPFLTPVKFRGEMGEMSELIFAN